MRTDPPGAKLYLDGRPRGTSPAEIPFTFYGQRRLEARKPGFAPAAEVLDLTAPWWQYPPFDIATEVLWPGRIEDRREVSLKLAPARADEEGAGLLMRARESAKEVEEATGGER